MKKMMKMKKHRTGKKGEMIVSAKLVMIIYSAIVIAFVVGACHVFAAPDPIHCEVTALLKRQA